MRFLGILTLTVFACLVATAQPNILGIANAASNRQAPLPGSELAQGSMVVFIGEDVGPESFIVDTEFPLGTTWQDVSVSFTVGGVTTTGIIYYAGPTQVAAILPSETPVGEGTATLTYEGDTSAPYPITVVTSNIAIYTLNSSGSGPAVATAVRPSGEQYFVLPGDSVRPGDIVILWSNGLGPVGFEETMAAPGGDMTEVPLEVFVGGVAADLLYRGRDACCSSVDVIYIRIPEGAAGCATSILMKIGTLVSNTVTIPVAESGSNCTPTNPFLSQATVNRLIGQDSLNYGTVNLTRTTNETPEQTIPGNGEIPDLTIPAMTTVSDQGGADFVRIQTTPSQFLSRIADFVTFGTCTVSYFQNAQTQPFFGLPYETLDAGETIEYEGAAGFRTANRQVNQDPFNEGRTVTSYYGNFGDATPGNYIDPAAYTASWAGGPDVGGGSVTMTLPAHTIWTNRLDLDTVRRGDGVTVEWTGGDPNGWVNILASGVTYNGMTPLNVLVSCVARSSDHSFTIQPEVLSLIPATLLNPATAQLAPGTLSLISFTEPVEFTADGLDLGLGTIHSNTFITLTWE